MADSVLRAERPFVRLAAWITAVLSATAIAAVTIHFQWDGLSSIPYPDQWGWVEQYRDIYEHGLSLEHLLRQANEHRLVFPRLVFMLDMMWSRGDNRLDLLVSDILQATTLLVMLWMGRECLRSADGAVAAGIAAALLLNAVQSENLYWGYQVQFIMVYTAAVAAIALAAEAGGRPPRSALGCAAVGWCAATVASFSMANGVLAWPVMALLLALRRRWRLVAATLAVGLGEGALYARNFHSVASPDHTGPIEAVRHLAASGSYFLAYLGAVLFPTDPALARFGGVAALLAVAAWAWSCRTRFGQAQPWPRFAGGTVLFVLLSGAVTTVGRFRFGDIQALSPRYLTPGAILWAALTLGTVVEWRAQASWGVVRTACFAALAAAGILVCVHDEAVGVAEIERVTSGMGPASDAYTAGVRDNTALSVVTSDQPLAWAVRPFLETHRLGPFSDNWVRWLGRPLAQIVSGEKPIECSGSIDAIEPVGDRDGSGLRLEGWAWNENEGVPSRILLTDATGKVVGLATTGLDRPDIATAEPTVRSDFVGFTGFVRVPSNTKVTAYGIFDNGKRACKIDQ